jgi:hypothetical protein
MLHIGVVTKLETVIKPALFFVTDDKISFSVIVYSAS